MAVGTSSTAGAAALPDWSLIGNYVAALGTLERHELAALALTLGIIFFAVVTAIALLRTRARAASREAAARADIIALREEVDRANTLLLAEPQIVITWPAAGEEPDILGDTSIVTPAPIPRRALAFGSWLDPEHAKAMEHAVELLRARGESFAAALPTLAGRHVEVEGRAIGGRAIMRIRDVSGVKRELVELTARHQDVLRDIDAMRTLIEALPSPIWGRDGQGRLAFVNPAYARAVEARDPADAVARNLELLDSAGRDKLRRAHADGEAYAARLPVILAGTRRILDVFDLTTRSGSAGIGIDATEVETMRSEMARLVQAHRRTLDQLPTAVAIFGADQRLLFFNAAYRALWGLSADFLERDLVPQAHAPGNGQGRPVVLHLQARR